MKLMYDEDLLEDVVFLCASKQRAGIGELQIRRFYAERNQLYTIGDTEERNSAFFNLHLQWFWEWGLDSEIKMILGSFQVLVDSTETLAIRKARAKGDEGAELYVSGNSKNAVVALKTERFLDGSALARFLHHELMHLQDMVNPEFAYTPDVGANCCDASQQRLVRERYRVLWDVAIDGRLIRHGRLTLGSRDSRRSDFERGFAFLPVEQRLAMFETLWQADQPTHSQLLNWAEDPRNLGGALAPLPGAACPLCGCSTFAWVDASGINERIRKTIGSEFPRWRSEWGLCQRCAEVYAGVAG